MFALPWSSLAAASVSFATIVRTTLCGFAFNVGSMFRFAQDEGVSSAGWAAGS